MSALPKKLTGWHFVAGGVGLAVAGVGVWYIFYRIAEKESPPETRSEAPDPSLKAGTVMGYVKGVATPITVAAVGSQFMRVDAANAMNKLLAAARAAGHNLTAVSGYRTMASQQRLYDGYVQKLPGFNMAAKPGYSNHQGGTAMDVGGVGSYESAAYKWLAANAARYGFKNDVRGEWWHWTFYPSLLQQQTLSGFPRLVRA